MHSSFTTFFSLSRSKTDCLGGDSSLKPGLRLPAAQPKRGQPPGSRVPWHSAVPVAA